ncbi:GNAT family N-acetyltransferase [Cupriavidus sp. PET2-C1]
MGLTMEEELSRPIEGFRDQLSSPAPNAVFGAFEGEELVGTAAISLYNRFPSSRHRALLWGVFVSPHRRRQELGRNLVTCALSHARENDIVRVNLTVYVPNLAAVALYIALGFQSCGVESEAICLDGTYYDGVQMSFRLSGE